MNTNVLKRQHTGPKITRFLKLSAVFSAVAIGTLSIAATQMPAKPLLVLSKTDHVLEIRDANSFALAARVPVGPDPHEIEVSPDGRTAYVSNPGYGALHRIDVIDLVAGQAKPSIDTAPLMGPHGLSFVQGQLWFTAQGSKALGRYDPATGKVDWTMGTGQDTTHLLHVNTDGKRIQATNAGSGTVSLFEQRLVPPAMPPTGVMPAEAKPRLDWVQTVVPVGAGAEGFDVSPDERELWTARPDGTLVVVDITSGQAMANIDSGLQGAHRLKFTPDGQRVMVVSVKTGALMVLDAASRKPIKTMSTGRGAGIYMDASGNRAFISCTPDGFVAVIDLATLTETARLPVARPDGIAIASPQ
ncbi:YncE family protein [Variovorax sp. HJSM1_2]|uniref:YncE family protein n=1 Tax=Variovorax sp. HJSM1_2 TaxID=3366263 RepID=UPI003BBA287D